jgi:hypothetical protein
MQIQYAFGRCNCRALRLGERAGAEGERPQSGTQPGNGSNFRAPNAVVSSLPRYSLVAACFDDNRMRILSPRKNDTVLGNSI